MKVTGIIFAIAVFGVAVLVGTAGAEPMSPGMKAWGERLQGEARVYQQLQLRQLRGTTALGLEAWGKRLQAEVGVYRQLQQEQGATALGLVAWGKRLQGEARVYQRLPRR
jgi:hypothetical protein